MQINGTKVLSGRGLLHRRWDKRQLGCIAANAADGLIDIDWAITQLSAALKVSRGYIDLARTLSPEKRQAIIDGRDQTSFAALLKAPPALPAPRQVNGNGKCDSDAEIVAIVRKYGSGRVLDACVAVEAAQE
jgi:hypothetical protein